MLKKNQIMITALALMIAVAGYLNFAGNKTGKEELVTASADAASEEDLAMLDLSEEDITADIESLDSEVAEVPDYLSEELQTADASVLTGEAGADAVAANSTSAEAAILEDGVQDLLNGTTDLEEENTDLTDTEVPGEAVFTSTSSVASLSGAKLLKEQTRAKNKETLLEIINNANIDDSQKQEAVNGMIELTEIAEKESAAEILLEAKGFSDVVVSMNGDGADVVVASSALTDAQRAQIEDIVKRKTGVAAENIIISPVSAQE